MRLIIISSVLYMLNIFGCTKQPVGSLVVTDINITQTNSPLQVLQGQDIVSQITCIAPNPCYTFYTFEVSELQANSFKIKAKANYDTEAICIQVLHRIDTTLRIKTTVKGQYVLNFYNSGNLFKTEIVMVN